MAGQIAARAASNALSEVEGHPKLLMAGQFDAALRALLMAGQIAARAASNALSERSASNGLSTRHPAPVKFLCRPSKTMPEVFPTVSYPATIPGLAWVYILQSADGSLYIGQTTNLPERLRKHRLGLGSKHTHDHVAPRLVYCEGPMPLDAAVQREAQLKRWSRAKKEALVRGDLDRLKALATSRDGHG